MTTQIPVGHVAVFAGAAAHVRARVHVGAQAISARATASRRRVRAPPESKASEERIPYNLHVLDETEQKVQVRGGGLQRARPLCRARRGETPLSPSAQEEEARMFEEMIDHPDLFVEGRKVCAGSSSLTRLPSPHHPVATRHRLGAPKHPPPRQCAGPCPAPKPPPSRHKEGAP